MVVISSMDGAPLMMRSNDDHHGTQMPLASAVHTITETPGAREIHEGSAEARGIYGEASPEEVRALVDDGVPVAALPPAAPKKTEVN